MKVILDAILFTISPSGCIGKGSHHPKDDSYRQDHVTRGHVISMAHSYCIKASIGQTDKSAITSLVKSEFESLLERVATEV